MEIELFSSSSNILAKYYSAFDVEHRVLLTGHSHQAWPDCCRSALLEAWDDAARLVDDKWSRAFVKADRVRDGFQRLLHDDSGYITLGQNTHELLVRFLSALPLRKRPKLITTNGEFYSIRRQLDRLSEEGIEICRVNSEPVSQVVEQLIDALDKNTSAVLVSSVFFHNGQILTGLKALYDACERVGALLLIDVYHQLNVVPFSIKELGLEQAYIIGGGYKYCQLGEGVCFLRFPENCQLRPVITGWFAEFEQISKVSSIEKVQYDGGANRFAGATYDPVSHYRAAAVFDFFKEQDLTIEKLRSISQHQINLLIEAFDQLDLDPRIISRDTSIRSNQLAGFLTLTSHVANQICEALRGKNVFADVRGDRLRIGPAPYVADSQLLDTISLLEETVKSL